MVRATVLIKARNGNDNGLPRHQTRMPKTETQIWLKQDEGSNRTSSFGPKWYTIAPPHRYNFSPALTLLNAGAHDVVCVLVDCKGAVMRMENTSETQGSEHPSDKDQKTGKK